MKKTLFKLLFACWAIAAGSGCTSVNVPLNSLNLPLEAREKNHTRAELGAQVMPWPSTTQPGIVPATNASNVPHGGSGRYFVGLALSGGGSRSAVFATACMFELQRLGLLQKVDYISSVSGGSLAAAYYCTSGEDWNPATAQRKMTHSFARDIFLQLAQPWTLGAVMFTDLDRSDLLANSLRDNVFNHNGRELTFADLRSDRPHLLMNATDLQSGRGFVFCNESFDEINSDLSKYPIAHAVAASSAVPVVMHQVTLRDYSTIFKQYKHLIDGGINDNLGITTLLETYDAQVKAAEQAGRPSPYPNGAIFLVIDARTEFDTQISEKGDTGILESLEAGVGLTSTSLLNRASAATLSEMIVRYSKDDTTAKDLRDEIAQLTNHGTLDLQDHNGRPMRVVHLALSRLSELSDVPFHSFGEKVNGIATYFNIGPDEAYDLYKAAELLVKEKFEPRLTEISKQLNPQ